MYQISKHLLILELYAIRWWIEDALLDRLKMHECFYVRFVWPFFFSNKNTTVQQILAFILCQFDFDLIYIHYMCEAVLKATKPQFEKKKSYCEYSISEYASSYQNQMNTLAVCVSCMWCMGNTFSFFPAGFAISSRALILMIQNRT